MSSLRTRNDKVKRGSPAVESLLCPSQVARRLNIGLRTLWRWIAEGKFPRPIRLSKLVVRWRAEDVERWLSEKAA